ncbi:ATP-NAD kinase-like domain-containing protein [Durotheca rogersii]|uniref:ATP-NAD kinase-like domain-containing protein n=1 Tax=Durotheca rogersii TaxID=419775 RepID=UPI0022206456|nr:ATP-NAD kinase-like domain-containing protein [Durotheca rogersii]KAI5865058.1 ATP-NAD kinase-like domain-containing protein [Durotheca rogersii]
MDIPFSSVPPEEVIFISRQPQPGNGSKTYNVFSLRERDEVDGQKSQLLRAQTAEVPQPWLDEFLVEEVPEHLQSGPLRHVHVVVSTHSGTGLALDFYNSVLQPVLQSWGVSASEPATDLEERSRTPTKPGTYNLVITRNAHSLRDFARDIHRADKDDSEATAPQQTILLLSGDGGIIEILNGKAATEGPAAPPHLPLVAVLPLGTGNALFHSVHKFVRTTGPKPSGLVQGLRSLFTGKAAPLPSFIAEFSAGSRLVTYTSPDEQSSSPDAAPEGRGDAVSSLRGVIVASYGFHSQLVWESDTPEYRKHGAKRFGMVAQQLLGESHAYEAVVELTGRDGAETRTLGDGGGGGGDRHAYVLAAMVSNLEATFTISPASAPLDGKLRVVRFGAADGAQIMEVMRRAYDGGAHVGMRWRAADGTERRVAYDEARELRVTTRERDPRWRKVCVDGSIVELPPAGRMTVRTEDAAHLRVLVHRSVAVGG